MPTTTRRTLRGLLAVSLVLAACGDDDTETASGDGGAKSAEAYCELVDEFNNQAGPPTAEQLEKLKQVRPDEIGDSVDFVADAMIEADGDMGKAFADPEMETRMGDLEAFEADNCGGGDDGGGDVPDAGAALFCEQSARMDEQTEPPSLDQVIELALNAPDEIKADVNVVVDAFAENEDDLGAIFGDPAVNDAIEKIEAWESENCEGADNGDGGDDGDEGDTEAADGATVVPVAGVDFGFDGLADADLTAGPTAFEFTNDGEAIHELAIFALDGGTTEDVIARAEAAFESGDDDAIGELGYAFVPPGGDARYVNVELEAGDYVAICFIPGPGGAPHHELGMEVEFTVG